MHGRGGDHLAMEKILTIAFLIWMPMTACLAQSTAKQACNVEVDVTDTDPKGTNVRAAPSGAVVSALKNPSSDGYIVVHLTCQLGDWYEIDRAKLIGTSLPSGEKILFQGTGYLHKSVVGVSGMQNGGIEFLKVHVKKGIGWTRQACTNMNTTCS